MKKILCFLALLLTANCRAQILGITLEHNSISSFYNNLDTALTAAQNGDNLYLSGGAFTFSGNISKGVNIFGAGFFPDSTMVTLPTVLLTPTNTMAIGGSSANNLFVTGLKIQTSTVTVSNTSNIIFNKCEFGIYSDANVVNVSNVSFAQCIFGRNMLATNTTGLSAKNCIFYSGVNANAAVFENNIFFYAGSVGLFSTSSTGVNNSFFRNNIVYLNTTMNSPPSGNYFYNNLFTDSVGNYNTASSTVFLNNQFNKPLNTIFQNVVYSTSYLYSADFHLKIGSPAIGAGINGTDAGIYGGSDPFKNGSVPVNPHIQKFSVPTNTDPNGNLLINVSVKAQNN